MRRNVIVLVFSAAMLVTVGFASANSTTGALISGPVPAVRAPAAANAGPTTIHWDKFYDRSGNPLPVDPGDNVGTDSLYFKNYSSTTVLYGCPKSEVPDPTPEDCRPAFAWQTNQTVVGMDPLGNYCYEVYNTTLRRHSTSDGTYTDYTIARGYQACGTDGNYLYAPVGDTVFKYTPTGTLVSSTILDITPQWYEFSVVNDTIWCGTGVSTLNGYACSKFIGGSLTLDAAWDVGTGTGSPAQVGWDGQYYYVSWAGYASNTFKRFNPDRTLLDSGTVSVDTRGVMCKKGDYGVMICHGASYTDDVASLAQMLTDSSGGKFAAVDTYYIGNVDGHATFPATDWYDRGYRVILAFTDAWPEDPVALGDSLARFVQLGGGVVDATFSDCSPYHITGSWRSMYAPFTVTSAHDSPGTMGTVHQPVHPVLSGVSDLYVGNFRSGNTHVSLRSPNCVCLAEYTDSSRCLVASFDSAGQRAVSLGMYPLDYWISSATGDWCRLLVNALDWTAVGPSVGVTVPDGGESWIAGTVHDITWMQTGNGVRDSIYYSTDAGSSWLGVAHYDPAPVPLQHAWTVPSTPTTEARVKVVTWNADGGRVEDASDSNFTIAPYVGIAQPEDSVLPLAVILYQPYPNPLASGTTIRYALPGPAQVELRIYDVAGTLVRRLADGVQPAGYRNAYWDAMDDRGRRVATGVYYCRFMTGDFSAVQKLVVRR
jgi:hypothetical protein